MLEKLGCRVDVAADGAEAVAMATRFTYEMIFMDVRMPHMDGLEATRRIRARAGSHAPRIVAMTANAMQEDRQMCYDAGMDDFVAKPILLGTLRDALRRAGHATLPHHIDRFPMELTTELPTRTHVAASVP